MEEKIKEIVAKLNLDTEYLDETMDNVSIEDYEEVTGALTGIPVFVIWPNIPLVTNTVPDSYVLKKGTNWIAVKFKSPDACLDFCWDEMETTCKYGAPVFDHYMTIHHFRN